MWPNPQHIFPFVRHCNLSSAPNWPRSVPCSPHRAKMSSTFSQIQCEPLDPAEISGYFPKSLQSPLWFFTAEGYSLAVTCRFCCWNQHTTHSQFMTFALNPVIRDAMQLKINMGIFFCSCFVPKVCIWHNTFDIFWFKCPHRMFTCPLQNTHRAVCAELLVRIIGAVKETRVLTAVCWPLQSKEHFRWP